MLRTRLAQITENRCPDAHISLIEALRGEHVHTIHALTDFQSNRRYNCVMHALGIEDNSEYLELAKALPEHIHADTKFLHFMIDRHYLEERTDPVPGSLAVYFDHIRPKHVGRVLSETRVVSKWGAGHLYEHAMLEVPSGYGSAVRFFLPPPSDAVINIFHKYVKARGVSYEGADG